MKLHIEFDDGDSREYEVKPGVSRVVIYCNDQQVRVTDERDQAVERVEEIKG